MSMENFGIDVKVNLDTEDASGKVEKLSELLDQLQSAKENKISLDLGMSKANLEKFERIIKLTNSMEAGKFASAFEVSDKAIASLKALGDTAEKISKLNSKQSDLLNLEGVGKKTDAVVKKYKEAQNEIKKLQTQMSTTKDGQVLDALGQQLKEQYDKLESYRSKMDEKQLLDIKPVDTKNLQDLERVYGKIFDGIQDKAVNFQNKLNELFDNRVLNVDEYERLQTVLSKLMTMSFKDSQDFKPLSDSLKQLKQAQYLIDDFSKAPTKDSLISKSDKDMSNMISKYKKLQNEAKSLESQLVNTNDGQVMTALANQLARRYDELDNLYQKMNKSQRESVQKLDVENVEKLERVYGKAFDSIQKKAQKMQTQLNKIAKSEIVDKSEVESIQNKLDGILKMDFNKSQDKGFSPFAKALSEADELKARISELNKSTKLDGFNQSDLVKEWKNLSNIITSTKKELASTTNANNKNSYTKTLKDLEDQLEQCYDKMTDVDKKTVDTISKFNNIKLNTSFNKMGEGLLRDIKKLEGALDSIEKKEILDGGKLKNSKKMLNELSKSLNEKINTDGLDAIKLSKSKNEIEKLKSEIKSLGEEAQKALKISDFKNGIDIQLGNMKSKFKDALPDEEVVRLKKLLEGLDDIPMSKLPSTFKTINSEIQKAREVANELDKVLKKTNKDSDNNTKKEIKQIGKDYEKLEKIIDKVSNKFKELNLAGVFNENEVKRYAEDLETVVDLFKKLDLTDTKNVGGELKNLLGMVESIGVEFREFKMPDTLGQWKVLNQQLTQFKKAMASAYDPSTLEVLDKAIKETQNSMDALISKMKSFELDDVIRLSDKSDSDLQNYFREQADGSIKEIDKIISKIKELNKSEFADVDLGNGLIKQLEKLKAETKSGISLKLINENSINHLGKSMEEVRGSAKAFEKSIKELGANATKPIQEYAKLSSELEKLEKKMINAKTFKGMDGWGKRIEEVKTKMTALYDSLNIAEKKVADSLNIKRTTNISDVIAKDVDKARTEIEKLERTFDKIGEVKSMDSSKISNFKQEIKELSNALESGDLDGRKLAELKRRIKEIGKEASGLEKVADFSRKIEEEMERLESSIDSPRLKGAIKQIREDLEKLGQTDIGSRDIEKQMNKIERSMKSVQKISAKTGTFFSDIYDSMRTFTLGNMVGDALQTGVYAIKDTIIGLDSAVRDMMKVAPASFEGTVEQLRNVQSQAKEVAISVGRSTEDVIQGMAQALQTGAKTMGDALEISKSSAIFANVGGLEQAEADKHITSVMSAFFGMNNALKPVREQVQGMGKDYNNLTNFLDQANYAGNNFAVSTGDIGEALQRSGSVLSNYGLTLDESVALIVGANESIQDASKVGTSLKTMGIRLGSFKANAKDGTMELNKTAKTLKEIAGIEVYSNKQKGEVKDMMELLHEINGVWDTLSEDKQLAIGEAIAGVEHANTFQSLMGNWQRVLQYQNEYNAGWTVGSAEAENSRYLDSIEGRINVLKESLKSLVTNAISSDMFKGMVDGATQVVNAILSIVTFILSNV